MKEEPRITKRENGNITSARALRTTHDGKNVITPQFQSLQQHLTFQLLSFLIFFFCEDYSLQLHRLLSNAIP